MNKQIQLLTTQSIAPYGRLLDSSHKPCTKSGEHWVCYSNVDYLNVNTTLSVGVVHCDAPPHKIDALERHVSREELLWATTEDLVLLLDLPENLSDENAQPNADTSMAFLLKAGQAVIISKGTWHAPAFSLQGNSKYFFLVEDKKDTIDQDSAPWIPFLNNESITIII